MPGLTEALQLIVGQRFASVVFVQDYWQLVWDDAKLTVLNPMSLSGPGYEFDCEHDLFPKRLVDLISSETTHVEVTDDEFVKLHFQGDKTVSISLRAKDYVGPEALIYRAEGMEVTWVI